MSLAAATRSMVSARDHAVRAKKISIAPPARFRNLSGPGFYFRPVSMRLLDRYLGRELIVSALFAVLTLSLVLVLGQIFKQLFKFVVDHNVPATYIITFVAYVLPLSLIFSIPWGFLTAVLLVFGRLSGGNEFTAMRTAGISTWRIARPILVLAVLFSFLCLWINLYVAPQAQQKLKNAFFEVATTNPAAAFSGDKVINDFPRQENLRRRRAGPACLQNIHVFSLNAQNKPMQVVYARTGRLETDLANKQIKMRLENSRFEQRDNSSPDDLTKIQPATMGDFVFPISLEELYAQKQGRKKVEALTYDELKDDLQHKRDQLARDQQTNKDCAGREYQTDWYATASARSLPRRPR